MNGKELKSMTSKSSTPVTYKDVVQLFHGGQNIFRRPSILALLNRISELEMQTPVPTIDFLPAESIELYAIDENGSEQKIEDLYWFEENFVQDWRGHGMGREYSFRIVVRYGV